MPKAGYIGIDIGAYSLKIAQVARAGNSWQLIASAVIPRMSGCEHEQPHQCSGLVRAALDVAANCRGSQTACALPRGMSHIHETPIDNTSELAVDAQIEQALLANPTFRPDHITASWLHSMQEHDHAYTVQLAPEKSDRLAGQLRRAGLDCRHLDALPLTLARMIAISDPRNRTETVGAIDWGYSGLTICTVREGAPIFVRCLQSCGFEPVVQNIQHRLRITSDEAVGLLRDFGLPMGKAGSSQTRLAQKTASSEERIRQLVHEAIAEPLRQGVDEIRRTLSFLEHRRTSAMPVRLVLFGGCTRIRNIAEWLTRQLHRAVAVWNPASIEGLADDPRLAVLGHAISLSSLSLIKP